MLVEVLVGVISFFIFCFIIDLFNRKTIKLDGKHVLVTGGSSGIGKSLAVQLAKCGANVTIVARNEERLTKAKEEITDHLKQGRKVQMFSVDLSHDIKDIEVMISKASAVFGPVDCLFNCAGYAICGRFEDLQIDDFKKMMNTNYFGSVFPTYAVIKTMKERKQGHVVFVSSMGGQLGIFGLTAYSASKFAIRGFAECLVMEVKPYNIGVSVVYPPDTDTPGFENENRNKPEETNLICSSGGLFHPDHVAQTIIKGVQSGQFQVTCGLDGWALSTVTSGTAPFTSYIQLVIQAISMGLLRIVMAVYSIGHDRIAKEGMLKRELSK